MCNGGSRKWRCPPGPWWPPRSSRYDDRRNKVVNIHATTQLKVVLVKPERFENAIVANPPQRASQYGLQYGLSEIQPVVFQLVDQM